MKKINGIRVTMPFVGMKPEYTEVTIESDEIIYSEANIYAKSMGYGLQVNDEEKREIIKKLCFDISEKVKELYEVSKTK
jgi:hypothetical protein